MEQRILPPEIENALKLTARSQRRITIAATLGWLLIVAIVAWSCLRL
jgi:hypothetical protein